MRCVFCKHEDFNHSSRSNQCLMQECGCLAFRPQQVQQVDDPVNHPTHYTQGPMEVIDIIEGFNLGFHLGNVVKYVLRAEHKNGLEDLKKARWYLNRQIESEERKCQDAKKS